MNPDTEQHGYHARHVTAEQQAAAERLVRRMAPGHSEAILTALGLLEPPPPPAPPPPPRVEVCGNGHPRTEENTRIRWVGGKRRRDCRDCDRARHRAEPLTPARPDTHCRHGHEWTDDNTRIDSEGTRRCRECQRTVNRAASDRRREQRQAKREAQQGAG